MADPPLTMAATDLNESMTTDMADQGWTMVIRPKRNLLDLRLGELYEARGDRKRAREYYEKFVTLWKDADPELQPGVKEVRGRLAKLAQEPGA